MLTVSNPTQLIMVSYHRPNVLLRSIASILTNTNKPFHLTIIDNSCGLINETLATLRSSNITIYKNNHNFGKGRAVMTWYNKIAKTSPYIVSIDPDIEVPPNWLWLMEAAAYRIRINHKFGILAPVIDRWSDEHLVMHHATPPFTFVDGTIKVRQVAGPLLIIDRDFFDSVGFVQTQLYGNDDGELCKAAVAQNRFVGIVPNVIVNHLDADDDAGYRAWKHRNVRGNFDSNGYWDPQSQK